MFNRRAQPLVFCKRRRRIQQQIPRNIRSVGKFHGKRLIVCYLIQHIVGDLIRAEQHIDFAGFEREHAAVFIRYDFYGKRIGPPIFAVPRRIFRKTIGLSFRAMCRFKFIRAGSRRIRKNGTVGVVAVFKHFGRKHAEGQCAQFL